MVGLGKELLEATRQRVFWFLLKVVHLASRRCWYIHFYFCCERITFSKMYLLHLQLDLERQKLIRRQREPRRWSLDTCWRVPPRCSQSHTTRYPYPWALEYGRLYAMCAASSAKNLRVGSKGKLPLHMWFGLVIKIRMLIVQA